MKIQTFLVLLLLLSTSACHIFQPKGEPEGTWHEEIVEAPSDRFLWQVMRLSLRKMRFPSAGSLDPSSGKLKSGWKTELHPFQGEGFRERAEIETVPIEKGRWTVRTRVGRQTNESLVSPLDPTRAEWEWAPDNQHSAQILLMHICSLLDPEMEEEEKLDPLDELIRRADER